MYINHIATLISQVLCITYNCASYTCVLATFMLVQTLVFTVAKIDFISVDSLEGLLSKKDLRAEKNSL